MTGRGRKIDSMSAVYATASGLYSAPPTRQATRAGIIEAMWQPTHQERFDMPAALHTSDELPELLEALYVRNKNWAAIAKKMQRETPRFDDEDLYLPSSARRR